jgi:hypothetical protein
LLFASRETELTDKERGRLREGHEQKNKNERMKEGRK